MRLRNPFDLVERKPVVIGTGLIALDVVVNGEPDQPPKLWAGGTCGNVLTLLSYLGWEAFPVSRLNGDSASELIQKDLKRWGVRMSFSALRPSSDTPIIIQRTHKDASGRPMHRFSWNCPKCGAFLPRYRPVLGSSVQKVTTKISKPRVVFLDRLSRGALILAKEASKKGAIVFFEPSARAKPHHLREVLEIAHILKYSHERRRELCKFTSKANLLLEIETLGKEGLRFRNTFPRGGTKGWQKINAYEVSRMTDAAGAGDWCTAGIIHRIGQGGVKKLRRATPAQITETLRFGQALAAWNCQFEGARGGMYYVGKREFQLQIKHIMRSNSGLQKSSHRISNPSTKHKDTRICSACNYDAKVG